MLYYICDLTSAQPTEWEWKNLNIDDLKNHEISKDQKLNYANKLKIKK